MKQSLEPLWRLERPKMRTTRAWRRDYGWRDDGGRRDRVREVDEGEGGTGRGRVTRKKEIVE
ncbi:hypothetical protein LguiB_032778 [Lonicera macranthoides]